MYYNGQIVWSYTLKRPVSVDDVESGPDTTHFIDADGEIVCPDSVAVAEYLMATTRISPAPLPWSHCHKCGNWNTNHYSDGSCWRPWSTRHEWSKVLQPRPYREGETS